MAAKPTQNREIAQRGLKSSPGSERIKTTTDHKSTTIGAPPDVWIDQARFISKWDNNPLGFHQNDFGQHLWDLSSKIQDKEEYNIYIALLQKVARQF